MYRYVWLVVGGVELIFVQRETSYNTSYQIRRGIPAPSKLIKNKQISHNSEFTILAGGNDTTSELRGDLITIKLRYPSILSRDSRSVICSFRAFNWLQPNDAAWRHRSGSTLESRHYMNQYSKYVPYIYVRKLLIQYHSHICHGHWINCLLILRKVSTSLST